VPECHKCPANGYKGWIDSGLDVPIWQRPAFKNPHVNDKGEVVGDPVLAPAKVPKVVEQRDEAGNVMFDSNNKPIFERVLDKFGDVVMVDKLDDDGEPVLEQVMEDAGGMSQSDATWMDMPCSFCEYNPNSPNNQGKTLISFDALVGERGDDFDDEKPMSETLNDTWREKIALEISEARNSDMSDREFSALVDRRTREIQGMPAEYADALTELLEVWGVISRLPEVPKRAVEWKLNDQNASFDPLAEKMGVTIQYVNQKYLEALAINPVLGNMMKNRSGKVQRYSSEHVTGAQSLSEIMKGIE